MLLSATKLTASERSASTVPQSNCSSKHAKMLWKLEQESIETRGPRQNALEVTEEKRRPCHMPFQLRKGSQQYLANIWLSYLGNH